MAQITLRLVGFGDRASSPHVETRGVPQGITLNELCESVGATIDDRRCLALTDAGPVCIVLNGRQVRRATGFQAVLDERDVVTFIVLAAGG